MTFEEVFRVSYSKPVRDSDTGEMTTKGKLMRKRHEQIVDLAKKVLKKAEDM